MKMKHKVCVTLEGGKFAVYFNGKFVAAYSFPHNAFDRAKTLLIEAMLGQTA